MGRICGVCGNIGQIEKLAFCSVCETACRHTHCAQAPSNQLGIWYCQTCKKQQTKMPEEKKLDKAGETRRFENSKVKFLSSEEVISMGCGTVRRCIKTTTTSVASSIQTAPPSETPTHTRTTTPKSVSGSKDMGHKLSNLKGHLPYRPAPIAWKGPLEVRLMIGKQLVELVAYLPLQVSAKLYRAIATLPSKLQMKMVPHCNVWPKQFKTDLPNIKDIGVYLLPSETEKRYRLKCSNLLRQLDSNKCALKMNLNAHLELVVYSSQILAENSQRIEGNFFFWGFFWKRKMSSCSKKTILTSPHKTPSRTNSELGASPDFKTPIAIDKSADILKHNPVENEVIADISDICENKSLEKAVVAGTSDVLRGYKKPPIGQETYPMDRQSETSMRVKETQPVNKGVSPGCSPIVDIANEGSDCRRFFSSIGVALLAPVLTDTTSEQTAGSESKRAPKLSNASLETAPDRVFIKQEKEALIPLPVGLEMPPGFVRRVETREDQQLDTLPGFGTSGRVFIKQEKDLLIPLPVGLEVPPGFSRERNISNESSSRSPTMNQVLNASSFVPENSIDIPLSGNQGIVHQGAPVSQRTVVFSDQVFQGTPVTPRNLYRSRSRSPASRQQSRSRSPVLRRKRSRSRSPVRRRERNRSPVRRQERSRSRSPMRRRKRSRSRSPIYRRKRSRSRSPIYRWKRNRSRSNVPRRHRSRSRSSQR